MPPYTFTDATGVSFSELAEQITASFAGYFFPMTMTATAAADFWRVEQIDATRSLLMRDEAGEFVGMAWVATRGARGCCAAFGIVSAHRRRGSGRFLAGEMVSRARASGLERLQIEVLTQNAPAIKVYEGVGFRTRHRLVGMEVETDHLPDGPALSLTAAPFESLLPCLVPPQSAAWGNELPSLLAMRLEAAVSCAPDGTVLGGLAVQRSGERVIVRASAFPAEMTTPEFSGWLISAAGAARTIALHNEIDGTPLVEHCRALGFRETFSQHEMALDL